MSSFVRRFSHSRVLSGDRTWGAAAADLSALYVKFWEALVTEESNNRSASPNLECIAAPELLPVHYVLLPHLDHPKP